MPKYKISKENINEFFGLFGKEGRQARISKIIANDPVLKKIDAELKRLNTNAAERIKSDPYKVDMFRRIGIDIDDIG